MVGSCIFQLFQLAGVHEVYCWVNASMQVPVINFELREITGVNVCLKGGHCLSRKGGNIPPTDSLHV